MTSLQKCFPNFLNGTNGKAAVFCFCIDGGNVQSQNLPTAQVGLEVAVEEELPSPSALHHIVLL